MSTELMLRYFAGQLSRKEKTDVEKWLIEHDEYRRELLELLKEETAGVRM